MTSTFEIMLSGVCGALPGWLCKEMHSPELHSISGPPPEVSSGFSCSDTEMHKFNCLILK